MAAKYLFIGLIASCLTGCAFNFLDTPEQAHAVVPKKTLATIDFEPLTLDKAPIPAMDLFSLRDAYQQLQTMVSEPQTRQIVQYRLADLEILLAEQKQEEGLSSEQQGLYDLAINQYQQILREHPQQQNNAQVLYQLAKAYDLQGQSQQSFETIETLLKQYPQNPYLAEVYFRKGEILFAENNYLAAIDSYGQVLRQGSQSPYFVTAAYMLGWSHFKSEQTQQALMAFTRLLDHRLPDIEPQALVQVDSDLQLEKLAKGERRLVLDTIRIMALLFSYEGAELSVIAHFNAVGERHYEYLLYEQLGQQFLNDDRFRDSANVYQAFTQQHGDHHQAPFFSVKQIDAYILGKFPSLVLPAKQHFVEQYGINGLYWSGWSSDLQLQVSPFLHEYLQELAQFEHAKAQMLASRESFESPAESAKSPSGKTAKNLGEKRQEQMRQAFARAAGYYREFIQTFPTDPQTPAMTFNLGESLFEAGNYLEAISSYERYAYEYLDEPKAVEAGYAAILSYRQALISSPDAAGLTALKDRQLNSQSRFVMRFADDHRAVDVLHDSTQQLFELKRFEQAILAAAELLDWQPKVSNEKYLASLLVSAHSQFNLGQFGQAEAFYEEILADDSQSAQQKLDMTERLAASIYKQGEQKVAQKKYALAVQDFLRVITKAPGSSIRINAQFDAATHLLSLKDWQQASGLLEDFRVRFAGHSLTENIADKLIYAYQQSENWLSAADELMVIWKQAPETEQGRQALYVAAQYYQQEGKRQQSLESFRTYAHRYSQPFAEANEARFIMSEFYRESNEDSKRRYWLNKLIAADAQAGQARSDRSRYLAAMSSLVFAKDKFTYFKKIRLTLPLASSLKKKKSALEKALAAFDKTLGYQVAEFSTDAKYKVADIYHQLARDLMASQRPKGLNQLELEQYDILLEEQSYPFEEKAIELHAVNAQLSWEGIYDNWVKQSFDALAVLSPGRYDKQERIMEEPDEID